MLIEICLILICLLSLIKLKKYKINFVQLVWLVLMNSSLIILLGEKFNVTFINNHYFYYPSSTSDSRNWILILTFFSTIGLFSLLNYSHKKYINWNLKKIIVVILMVLLIYGSTLFYFSSVWTMNYFGNIHFDQIVYTLSQPLEGSDTTHIHAYIKTPLLNSTFLTLSSIYPIALVVELSGRKYTFYKKLKFGPVTLFITFLLLILGIFASGINVLGYSEIKSYYFEKTQIYDDYYVDTENVKIEFPDQKRNLIYIFLESMESTYSSREEGGIEDISLIPNLANYALNEGTNFSNRDSLGGMMSIPGANQTISAMVSQTSGVPLRTGTFTDSNGISDTNVYGESTNNFMPGLYSLGNILNKEGYNQMLYIGSPALFGGRDKYFSSHGDYEIRDYYWMQNQKLIPEDYHVWWGVEDEKLFPFAKESILELASKDEPFNFTMLTTDTHFEDGYLSDEAPRLFEDQYKNVIHYSDQQVFNFVNWLKEQPFYANTTVVIVGDHLTMDRKYGETVPTDYKRSVYNVILNSDTEIERDNKNRIFNATDMFPTTLAALGAKIEGNRLGLGTNLYSRESTLMEQLGEENFIDEIGKKSILYNERFVNGIK